MRLAPQQARRAIERISWLGGSRIKLAPPEAGHPSLDSALRRLARATESFGDAFAAQVGNAALLLDAIVSDVEAADQPAGAVDV